MLERDIELSFEDVSGLIPHRRPFRFIEGATIIEPGKTGRAVLPDRTHPDYSFLYSHFPGGVLFPGFLTAEAIAELIGVIIASGTSDLSNKIGLLASADKWRWRRPILPSSTVNLQAEVLDVKRNFAKGRGKAMIGSEIAAEGEVGAWIVDRDEFIARLR